MTLTRLAVLCLLALSSHAHEQPQQQRRSPLRRSLVHKTDEDDQSLGGFTDVADLFDPYLKAAATRAVYEFIMLAEEEQTYSFRVSTQQRYNLDFDILEARQQLVAGMNYEMLLELKDDENSCLGAFWVSVYDHFGERDVSEWGDEVPCSDLHPLSNNKLRANDDDDEDADEEGYYDYYDYWIHGGDMDDDLEWYNAMSDAVHEASGYDPDDIAAYYEYLIHEGEGEAPVVEESPPELSEDVPPETSDGAERRSESVDQVMVWSVCGTNEVTAFPHCGKKPSEATLPCVTNDDCATGTCFKVCIHEPAMSLSTINFCYSKDPAAEFSCSSVPCETDAECDSPFSGCSSMELCTETGICCSMAN